MTQSKLDQLWEHAALSRIGGVVQGGSTKTPREREAMDRQHEGRDDLDKPEGALPPQKPAPQQEHPPQVHPAQEHPRQEHVRQEHPAQVHPRQERGSGEDGKR
jgi:hypothetical protein